MVTFKWICCANSESISSCYSKTKSQQQIFVQSNLYKEITQSSSHHVYLTSYKNTQIIQNSANCDSGLHIPIFVEVDSTKLLSPLSSTHNKAYTMINLKNYFTKCYSITIQNKHKRKYSFADLLTARARI